MALSVASLSRIRRSGRRKSTVFASSLDAHVGGDVTAAISERRRRGVFRSTLMRATGALALDEDDQHELDAILDDLRPFFRVKGA